MILTKQEIIEWGERHGWSKDKWGHLKREDIPRGIFRIKLQKNSVRLEYKDYRDPYPQFWQRWKNIPTVYYRNLKLVGDHLEGLADGIQ